MLVKNARLGWIAPVAMSLVLAGCPDEKAKSDGPRKGPLKEGSKDSPTSGSDRQRTTSDQENTRMLDSESVHHEPGRGERGPEGQ